MGTFVDEELDEEELEKHFKGLIHIHDERKTLWDLFVILLAVWNVFSIPFEVAFSPHVQSFPLTFLQSMEGVGFLIMNSVIDFLFLIDILVYFRTTYYDEHTGDEV